MRTTVDIVRLSLGSSWTHNNAIWINLRAWLPWQVSTKVCSINCSPLPSFHIRQSPCLFYIVFNYINAVNKNFISELKIQMKIKRDLHVGEGFLHALDDRSPHSFSHLWFLALKLQSCKHRTLLKIALPLHTLMPRIHCWKKYYNLWLQSVEEMKPELF